MPTKFPQTEGFISASCSNCCTPDSGPRRTSSRICWGKDVGAVTPLYADTSGGRTGGGAGAGAGFGGGAEAGVGGGAGDGADAGAGTGAGTGGGTVGAAGTGDGAAASRGSLFCVPHGALASTFWIVSSFGGFSLSEIFFGTADGSGTGDGCGNGCDDDDGGGCGDGGESGRFDSGDDFLGAYFISLVAEAGLCDDAIWSLRVRRRRWLL